MDEPLERLNAALAGRYHIERKLGQGGMAIVYLAHDHRHDRDVALKVLRPDLAAVLGGERFLREIGITARLQHPHILPLLDSGEAAGLYYYVMPYVEGESLRARIQRERQLPLDQALQIAREVADALGHAHGHGIIHRDVKPENILLQSAHAVVADFGIARAVSAAGGERLTETGCAVGTPEYMSPEQAAGSGDLDGRSDLYSLGCVLYEMLSGEAPYTAPTPQAIFAKKLREPLPRISVVRDTVPPGIEAVLLKALARTPADRFSTAAEFAAALAHPESAAALVPPPRRWRSWALRAGAAVAVLLAALVGGSTLVPAGTRATLFTLVQRSRAPLNPRRVLVAPFDNQTGDTTLDALGALAADWIGQGLSGVFGAEVVDPRTALGTRAIVRHIPWPLRRRDAPRAMAEEVGAGTLVSGTIYQEGDTLILLATITDVARGRLVRGLAPVRASRARPSRGLTELQERVAGSLAQVNEATGGTLIGSLAEPPSLEAYEEVYRGMEAYFRQDLSGQFAHLERAVRLDSSYTTPVVFLVFARTYHAQYAIADTLARRAERLSDHLVPAERALLDHLEAFIRGDREKALHAAERFTTLMPGSQESPLLLASVALSQQAPKVAIDALAHVDPDRGLNLVTPAYWTYQAIAAAQLGDWSRSLEMARAGRRRFPESPRLYELSVAAFARLGQVKELERAIADVPGGPEPLTEQARVAVRAWAELRACGRADAAADLMGRYAGLLREAGADTTRDGRFVRGQVLLRAGRAGEARAIFTGLASHDTGVARLRDLAQAGMASAGLNDRAGALQAERWIADTEVRYERGTPKLLQAEIAAALGERDRAVELLRQGLALGLGLESLGGALFGNPDLDPLSGYAPFEELLRPRG